MTAVKLLVLDEDTNDAAILQADLPEPPLAFDELVNAYDDSIVANPSFKTRVGPWAERHVWPLIEQYKYDDGEVSVLVTFLDSDPKGECEMEFYFEKGVLQ